MVLNRVSASRVGDRLSGGASGPAIGTTFCIARINAVRRGRSPKTTRIPKYRRCVVRQWNGELQHQ
jgi:hypothetical protein